MNDKKNKYLLSKYGISLHEFASKLLFQDSKCAICGRSFQEVRVCVDHRHVRGYKKLKQEEKKKEVRGLLCFQCNVMIGKLEKRRNARFLLWRTTEYFRRYRMFGDR